MALNIPLPSNDRSGLFQGLLYGHQRQDRQSQLQQEWQQHLQDMEVKRVQQEIQHQQQARLAELQPYVIQQYVQQAEKHPYIIQQYEEASKLAPLERQFKESQINNLISEAAQRNFDQEFVRKFMNGQNGPQGMPGQPDMQQPMPQPNAGPPGMVVGAPGTPSMGNVPPPSMEQLQNGFGGQPVHPYIAANMKKLTAWDPNAETPQMKSDNKIREAAEREKSKLSEKFRSQNLDSLEAAQDALADVEQADALLGKKPLQGEKGSPQYDYATSAMGPVDARSPAIREGTRKFRGEFNRLAGRMKANIARLEKGATSDKEREMFDKAEISESDSWTTAKGKLEAQKTYLTRLTERKKKIEDLMEMGYPRAKALEISMKETPFTNQSSMQKKIKIKSNKTGEEREVTQEEYENLKKGLK